MQKKKKCAVLNKNKKKKSEVNIFCFGFLFNKICWKIFHFYVVKLINKLITSLHYKSI